MIPFSIKPEDLEVIKKEKEYNSHPHIRKKLLVLYLKHVSLSLKLISDIAGVSANTIRSYIKEYRTKGLTSILTVRFYQPQSDLKKYEEEIKLDFKSNPPLSIVEASSRIEKLTGIKRSPSQIRVFLKSIGARPLKVGVIPGKAVTEKKKKSNLNFLIIS